MVRFTMEDTIRFLTEDSLEMFAKFLEVSAASVVKVNSTCDVIVTKIWVSPSHPSHPSPHHPLYGLMQEQTKFPLFMVDLQVQNGELVPSTQPRQFEERILSLFDKALSSVENIPQVERAIMKYLFWSHSPMLASVHKRDPKVTGAIQMARNAVRITPILPAVKDLFYCLKIRPYQSWMTTYAPMTGSTTSCTSMLPSILVR